MLFLLFAEARGAGAAVASDLPRQLQRRGAARRRRAAGSPRGLWDALRAIARLAHAGCRAGDLRVTPFNGRLFAPARTPLAERRDLDDEAARRALVALSTRPSRRRRRARTHRLPRPRRRATRRGLRNAARLRAAPSNRRHGARVSLLDRLRRPQGDRHVLHAAADRRLPGPPHARPAGARRDARSDPRSCASSIRRWAAARFSSPRAGISRARTRRRSSEPAAATRATSATPSAPASGERSPSAACTASISTRWRCSSRGCRCGSATLAADRPLSFLDHRLQVGDSLLGAWLRARCGARRRAARRRGPDDPLPLFDDEAVAHALREALPIRFSLEATPNDTLEQVRAKERALAQARPARYAALSRWKRIADLWCAGVVRGGRRARLPPSAFGALSDAVAAGPSALPSRTSRRAISTRPTRSATTRRLFHWELEFPEVFFDRRRRAACRTPASTR